MLGIFYLEHDEHICNWKIVKKLEKQHFVKSVANAVLSHLAVINK